MNPNIGQNRLVVPGPAHVTGQNRYKYFRRPAVSDTGFMANEITKKPNPFLKLRKAEELKDKNEPAVKDAEVQTMYRENETQTDPYSPEYIIKSGSAHPEVLSIVNLSYGAGLPVGLAEIEMIERARAKRAWESTLPEVVDQASLEKRLRMMEEMELKEWAEREQEIKRLQEARLKILAKALKERDEEISEASKIRIQQIVDRKEEEKQILKEKMNAKRAKALRKLQSKRNNVEHNFQRRDVIAEYANYGSKVYAPKLRDGGRRIEARTTEVAPVDRYEDFVELESLFPPSVLIPDISMPHDNKSKSRSRRNEQRMADQLEFMDKKLKELKAQPENKSIPLKFCEKIEKPKPRPPTPALEPIDEAEEVKHAAALLLQRLIRGRVSQVLMHQGKEKRLDLINELRMELSIQNALNSEQLETSLTQEEIPPPSMEEVEPTEEDKLETLFETSIQAEYVGQALDFLSKELVRLREEQRIAAMVKLAERTRRMREAAESGARQKEMKRRQIEDDIFRQVMQVHQETVDTYLEDIILGAVDSTSTIQAREAVQRYADQINSVVDDMEAMEDENYPAQVVAELVKGFLIPETEREILRQQVQNDQRQYLYAAHTAIYDTLPTIETKINSSDQVHPSSEVSPKLESTIPDNEKKIDGTIEDTGLNKAMVGLNFDEDGVDIGGEEAEYK